MKLVSAIAILCGMSSAVAANSNDIIDKYKDRDGSVISINCAKAVHLSVEYLRKQLEKYSEEEKTQSKAYLGRYDLAECVEHANIINVWFIKLDESTGTVARHGSVHVRVDMRSQEVIESPLSTW